MSGKYDDIINLLHHQSKIRPHMSLLNRAAQFSPFAALTGYGEAVDETARLTASEIDLAEDKRAELDRKLEIIRNSLPNSPEVILTYFVNDDKKEGGEYQTIQAKIKRIDPYERIIILVDKTKIPIDHIAEISYDNSVTEFDEKKLYK